jgi:hypothetical protein
VYKPPLEEKLCYTPYTARGLIQQGPKSFFNFMSEAPFVFGVPAASARGADTSTSKVATTFDFAGTNADFSVGAVPGISSVSGGARGRLAGSLYGLRAPSIVMDGNSGGCENKEVEVAERGVDVINSTDILRGRNLGQDHPQTSLPKTKRTVAQGLTSEEKTPFVFGVPRRTSSEGGIDTSEVTTSFNFAAANASAPATPQLATQFASSLPSPSLDGGAGTIVLLVGNTFQGCRLLPAIAIQWMSRGRDVWERPA